MTSLVRARRGPAKRVHFQAPSCCPTPGAASSPNALHPPQGQHEPCFAGQVSSCLGDFLYHRILKVTLPSTLPGWDRLAVENRHQRLMIRPRVCIKMRVLNQRQQTESNICPQKRSLDSAYECTAPCRDSASLSCYSQLNITSNKYNSGGIFAARESSCSP